MRPTATQLRLPHLPALDGIRALSVLAVFLYHTRFPWAAGGFLGVESFFVISGFLITSLLLREWLSAGRIDLRAFWLRRARRLLPAVWGLLLAAPVLAAFWMPAALPRLAEDTLAALVYATNLVYIVRQIPYFEQFAQPPLLQHLWSLAVEEQFYVVWPLVIAAAVRGLGIVSQAEARRLVPGLFLVALASTAWMAVTYDPAGDASRVYFGTDTRAAGFLVGALLAAAWQPGTGEAPGRRWQDLAGWGALAALLGAFTLVDEFNPWLYRGGFLAVAALTALVIRLALVNGTRFATILSSRPLAWLGARSYGVYLWHWPVVVLSGPALATIPWALAVAAQALVTVILAEGSYRWVEAPIRSQGFTAWARGLSAGWRTMPAQARIAFGAVVVVALSFPMLTAFDRAATVEPAQAAVSRSATPPAMPTLEPTATASPVATHAPSLVAGPTMGMPVEHDLAVSASPTRAQPTQVLPTPVAELASPTAAAPTPVAELASPTAAAPVTVVQPEPTVTPTEPAVLPTEAAPVIAAPAGIAITLIGDSVMLGAEQALANRLGTDVYIDAVVGRRMGDLFTTLDDLAARGKLAPTVVVHLGSNQPYEGAVFDAVMESLTAHGVQRVIFVNVRRPARWVEGINWRMAEGVARYPQAQLVDWFAVSNPNDDWFISDGTHLTGTGIGWYVEAIAAVLGR
ncbi:MAG: acyltransferase family protein [Anaerolineales bacterium]|nr:acyltransferase family protein [Anaerolineales bacterium]